jgi:hypothetical protein
MRRPSDAPRHLLARVVMSALREARVVELLSLAQARAEVIVPSEELRALIAYAVGCRKAQAERDFAQAGLKRVLERLDEMMKGKLPEDDDPRTSRDDRAPEAGGLQGG